MGLLDGPQTLRRHQAYFDWRDAGASNASLLVREAQVDGKPGGQAGWLPDGCLPACLSVCYKKCLLMQHALTGLTQPGSSRAAPPSPLTRSPACLPPPFSTSACSSGGAHAAAVPVLPGAGEPRVPHDVPQGTQDRQHQPAHPAGHLHWRPGRQGHVLRAPQGQSLPCAAAACCYCCLLPLPVACCLPMLPAGSRLCGCGDSCCPGC